MFSKLQYFILLLLCMYCTCGHEMAFSDGVLLRTGPWTKKLTVKRAAQGEELIVRYISQNWGKLKSKNSAYGEAFIADLGEQ